MAYSPYQIAGTRGNLLDLLQQEKLVGQESKRRTGKQRLALEEEFEQDLKAAQRKAKREAEKGSGFFKALNLVGMGLGPLGAALTSGISAGLQGNRQKKAMEGLLSGVDSKRWGKTFLRDPMKSYKEEAQDMQMSSGDVLRGAIGSGLTSFAMSKALGGDKESGGLFKKMFSKPADVLEVGAVPGAGGVGVRAPKDMFGVKDLTSTGKGQLSFKPGGAEMWQGAGELGESSFGIGGAKLQAPNLLSGQNIQGLGKSIGVRPDLISRPIGKMVSGGRATPMKTLWEQLQGFGEGKGGFDEKFQQSMMMPQLIQMLMSQIGGR